VSFDQDGTGNIAGHFGKGKGTDSGTVLSGRKSNFFHDKRHGRSGDSHGRSDEQNAECDGPHSFHVNGCRGFRESREELILCDGPCLGCVGGGRMKMVEKSMRFLVGIISLFGLGNSGGDGVTSRGFNLLDSVEKKVCHLTDSDPRFCVRIVVIIGCTHRRSTSITSTNTSSSIIVGLDSVKHLLKFGLGERFQVQVLIQSSLVHWFPMTTGSRTTTRGSSRGESPWLEWSHS
jgi:hypothetical protein